MYTFLKHSSRLLALLLVPMALFLTSCDNDDPEPENEEELITDVSLAFVPTGGGLTTTMTFTDLDGPGGNAPTVTGGTLAANTTYMATVSFLNAIDGENITEEVEEEDEEHQVFYQPSSGLNLTFSYQDQDANNNPLGIETEMVTGDASSGTLTVILRHEPDKDAAGVADGDISNAGGETDIEVTFDVDIQ